jgi:hypothetical protein
MSAQQQQQQQHVQPRPPQLLQQQQQQPWWANNPLANGIGSALQGMQHNLQQLANSLPKPPGQQHQQQVLSTRHDHAGTASTTFSGGTGGPKTAVVRQAPSHGQVAHTSAAAAATTHLSPKQQQQVKSVTKEELGRATWVFLHTLAAQFPERPSRQQQRDARQLMDSFTRIYPCADCAQHFQEIVR